MEGLAAGLKGMFLLVGVTIIALVVVCVVAIVASVVGWPTVMSWWPFGLVFTFGVIAGAWLRAWMGD